MKVFSQKGYHKATLDEICRRASLAKGTIYQHFSNKKGLFLGVVDSLLAELGPCVEAAVVKTDDDLLRLQADISAYVQFSEAHRSLYRLLIHEQSSFTKEIRERLHTRCFSHLEILEGVIRQGIKSGKIKKMDVRSAAFGLLGMCNSIIYHRLISDKPYSLDREVGLIVEIVLRGISR